jgi:hypothetical protein
MDVDISPPAPSPSRLVSEPEPKLAPAAPVIQKPAPQPRPPADDAGLKGTDASAPLQFISAYSYKQPTPLPTAAEEVSKTKAEEDEEADEAKAEDDRQWTPIIAFNIRTTFFNIVIAAACVYGQYSYMYILRTVGSSCDFFPTLALYTMAGYVFIAEPIFVLLVYVHRLLDSDEYDEFFSELHPYTGDVRDHGPLLIEID